jgi:hypothetical protein
MTIISAYDFLRVNNEKFMLDVTYDWHKCTWVDRTAVHGYDTITIRTSLLVRAYAILGHYRVNGYPLWLNVSGWSQGQHLKIADSYYEVNKVSQYWKARQYGIDLYYDGESGFLVRIYIDRTSAPDFWPTGYYIDITLGANNLGELASYMSGRYLIYDNLLIIGIFAELAIVNWLVTKRKNAKKPGTESSNSHPTANSLTVLK